jgi:hypothetical protein
MYVKYEDAENILRILRSKFEDVDLYGEGDVIGMTGWKLTVVLD